MTSAPPIFSLPTGPLQFEYLSPLAMAGIFVACAIPVLLLGRGVLRWSGPARGWASIGIRLASIWVLIMALGGAKWERQNHDVELIVLRDISASTAAVPKPANSTLNSYIDDYLRSAVTNKPPLDRIGQISFDDRALIDALPQIALRLDARSVRDSRDGGTDIASAVQLALASLGGDAMHRLLLISDGNQTQGDALAAAVAAKAAGVPIDVMPLEYAIDREIIVERVVAPAWRREHEPLSLDVVIRSTHPSTVRGRLSLTDHGKPIDVDASKPGEQLSTLVTLQPGPNSFRIPIAASSAGMHRFAARFEPDDPTGDALPGNNTADAFTFIRGRGRVLLVDNTERGQARPLLDALADGGLNISQDDHIDPAGFPVESSDLQNYDAVILANVPRGAGGLSPEQERSLVRYVHDQGGGLVMIGGPETFGAGGWEGSELEKILPLDMQIPSRRVLPAGAIVLVLDHSGSMNGPMGPVSKQLIANESAVLALQALLRDDYVGVVEFDDAPNWVVPLAVNVNPTHTARLIRQISPGGGTNIPPALQLAGDALLKITPQQAPVRRILLMTDGRSQAGDYDQLLDRLAAAKIAVSTIAVGDDADVPLLQAIADRGKGNAYVVTDPTQLTRVFLREARTLRRSLIHEPPEGITVAADPSAGELATSFSGALPSLRGMVLTSPKSSPSVRIPLRSTRTNDPLLAERQAGLGRVVAFTGDATSRWASDWIGNPVYGRFWTQVVRTVARPPMSANFDVRTVRDGSRTKLMVQATRDAGDGMNFLSIGGRVAGPDPRKPGVDIRLTQTGPGTYEADIDTPDPGAYLAALQYQSAGAERGSLLAGVIVERSPELRDLRSNDALLGQIALTSGGRMHDGFLNGRALFDREGLTPTRSAHPIAQTLLLVLLGLVLTDVAVRRIALDRESIRQMLHAGAAWVRGWTLPRAVEPTGTLAALQGVRSRIADERAEAADREPIVHVTPPVVSAGSKPATTASPPPAKPPETSSGTMGSLLEARRRARRRLGDDDP